MPKSFYKGERLGNRPPCAICMGRGHGERAELHLPAGVSVWLCAEHRSAEFQTRRVGRDFTATMLRVWSAAGCMSAARHRALDLHAGRLVSPPPARPRPGSYAWPGLRAEAERRFAAGEPPALVIRQLQEREGRGAARPPSRQTMYRWFREGRWLASPPAPIRGERGDGPG